MHQVKGLCILNAKTLIAVQELKVEIGPKPPIWLPYWLILGMRGRVNCTDMSNTILWNIEQTRTFFLNIDPIRTYSCIWDQTQTPFFWLRADIHRTSNLISTIIWITYFWSNRLEHLFLEHRTNFSSFSKRTQIQTTGRLQKLFEEPMPILWYWPQKGSMAHGTYHLKQQKSSRLLQPISNPPCLKRNAHLTSGEIANFFVKWIFFLL